MCRVRSDGGGRSQRRRFLGAVGAGSAALLVATTVPGTAAAAGGTTFRVSVSSSGRQGNSGSFGPSFSANGRYVAFSSAASNLVPGDTNAISDVFVRDLVSRSTRRASLTNTGGQANDFSINPTISGDGRYVAFTSGATNLVPGDTNGVRDVFVRDLLSGRTSRASLNSTGGQANGGQFNGGSDSPSISADGRHVAFDSDATNLVRAGADSNGVRDVFVRDLVTRTTRRVSLSNAGVQGNEYSYEPSISADGRYVAFTSAASNLAPGDSNRYTDDVFIRDTVSGRTRRVSVSSSGGELSDYSRGPSISADGQFVAYYTPADNVVPGDTNATGDVFVRDLVSGGTRRVSLTSTGGQGNRYSEKPSISANGRYVAFLSFASNLVSGDTNDNHDVFVRNLVTGSTCRVNVSNTGGQGNGDGFETVHEPPSISGNGRFVAFASYSSNLVPGDTNDSRDIFVRDTIGY